ncbi:hypothetical protein [Roseibium aggregatum]|uniref:Lipoprotein n=1 Tax=Roseibium aggregatum TaxID=187304 RepID=A0A939EI94_9HYPH|nr:hypothetical protein [Roseibium aggregatum]MBN9673458.1 hypothetical protein [Roseibium aggregatum]
MKSAKPIGVIFASLLAACTSHQDHVATGAQNTKARDSCDPGTVIERLENEMKTGLGGSGREKMSLLYDAYFQIMKKCNKVQDVDFVVKQEWGDKRTAKFLGFPSLNPYYYTQKKSWAGGLCLSREGRESGLLGAPKWYCEKGGWTDEI